MRNSSQRSWIALLIAVACGLPQVAGAEEVSEARRLALDSLRLEFYRDGVTAPEDVLKEKFSSACERGYNPACRRSKWIRDGQPSLEHASNVLETSCDGGDAVACMVVGWNLDATAESTEERDRTYRAAARIFKVHCDDGFQFACHEYGGFLYENKGLTADPRAAIRRWEGACDGGELASCTTLARLYDTGGAGIRMDKRKSTQLAKRACDGGYADACYHLGQVSDSTWTDPEIDEWYGRLCEEGHRDSCWTLARSYNDGVRPEPAAGRTHELFQEACGLGHPSACFEAGRGLEEGERRDDEAAAELFGRACTLGDAAGCSARVEMITSGRVDGSVKSASKAFGVACEQRDNELACIEYGIALIEGVDIPRDAERGRELLERTCVDEVSSPRACAALGRSFEEGLGGARDRTVASRYYRWACHSGNTDSCRRRGDLLVSDVGVRRDDHEALSMYGKACDGGLAESCNAAAVILDEATFVKRDAREAADFYARACEGSISEGCTGLGTLREEGLDGQPDMYGARDAYEAGITLGSITSMRRLAKLLWQGYGGKRDKRRARKLCQSACQGGDPLACRGPEFL